MLGSEERSIRMNRTISSIRAVIGGRRKTASAIAISGLVLVGLSASIGPAAASPAVPRTGIPGFTFASGSASLSGGGHKWAFALDVQAFGGTAFNAVGFGISTAHLGGIENHSWGGHLGATGLSVSSSAVMTVNSGSSLSPVASLKLTFRPTSHKTESADCISGSELVYTGSLKGSVRLRTGLKGLKLSGAHLSFRGSNTLTVLQNCDLAPCALGSWESSTNLAGKGALASGTSIAFPGRRAVNEVDITTSATLSKAKELFRIDTFEISDAKAPHFDKASKSLSVTSTRSGIVTGSATLAHGKPDSSQVIHKTCKVEGKEYTATGTAYVKAHYEPSRPFEAHTILSGTVKVKPDGPADFTIVTLKLK
jgi:hypothetical protein